MVQAANLNTVKLIYQYDSEWLIILIPIIV